LAAAPGHDHDFVRPGSRPPAAAGLPTGSRRQRRPRCRGRRLWPRDAWWQGYGDPQLDALEAEALAGSPDLRAADARTRHAQAVAQQAGAALGPDVSANAQPEAIRNTRNLGYPDDIKNLLPRNIHSQGRLTLDLAWDLDFFGRNRAALAAATSDAHARAIDAAAARLYLSASVAAAYADLLRLFRDREAAADALRTRKATLDLVSQ
jgi:outer membrane protein TolC